MTLEIEIKEVAPQPVLSIRGRTTLDQIGVFLDESLPAVIAFIENRQVTQSGPPFTRYHDMRGEHIDVEAGVPVLEPSEGRGDIEPSELPGGRVAAAIYQGPYEGLGEVHAAIESWIVDQDEEAGGGAWEVYWTSPSDEPDESRWKTEVVWPLR